MKIVSVDIDGTLRDIEKTIPFYIERDFSDELSRYYEDIAGDPENPSQYGTLSMFFEDQRVTREFERWLYFDRAFHIFGLAPKTNQKVVDHLNMLCADPTLSVWLTSVQKHSSIISTFFWLAKNGVKAKNVKFFDSFSSKVNWIVSNTPSIVIDDSPIILDSLTEFELDWNCDIFVPKWNYTKKYEDDDRFKMFDLKKTGFQEILDSLKNKEM